jgi:hypothetical protein
MLRTWLIALTSLLLTTTLLQGQTHDLELGIEVIAPAVTPPGATGRLILTITNHGPDPAGTATPTSLVGAFGHILALDLDYGPLIDFDRISDITVCSLARNTGSPLPGEPIPVAYTVFMSDLFPGETVICELAFEINPFAELVDPRETEDGNILNGWIVASPPGTDPNPDNNEVLITYQLVNPAQPIPTLSPVGLGTMVLGLLVAAFMVRRRRLSSPR